MDGAGGVSARASEKTMATTMSSSPVKPLPSPTQGAMPRVLPRCEHPISRRHIDRNAIKVLYRLHRAGHLAYLVGGGVRDLILGRRPKDFDVSTDARPNQIRRLFRNSRLIGRRFRLAHIMFRDSTVEVSTFRRDPDPQAQKRADGELLVTSDNTFGTPREDAFRRDFTINALFYNIADFTVLDYVGGIDDLDRRVVRVIGDPDVRFREDPVRMLRACEFAGRLGFTIESQTQEAIWANRQEIRKASPARMAEELVQLLRSGAASVTCQWLVDLGLMEVLLPEAQAMIEGPRLGLGDYPRILPLVDEWISRGTDLSDVVLLAALLVPQIEVRLHAAPSPAPDLAALVDECLAPFFARFPFSNLKHRVVCQTLETYLRLSRACARKSQRLKLANRSSFKDALQVLDVVVTSTGQDRGNLESWRGLARSRRRRRRSRRRRPRPGGETPGQE